MKLGTTAYALLGRECDRDAERLERSVERPMALRRETAARPASRQPAQMCRRRARRGSVKEWCSAPRRPRWSGLLFVAPEASAAARWSGDDQLQCFDQCSGHAESVV